MAFLTYLYKIWNYFKSLLFENVGRLCDKQRIELSAYNQTSSGAHPASCAMGIEGPFPGVTRGRGVTLTTHLSSAEVVNE
jgi:hypothetical protein